MHYKPAKKQLLQNPFALSLSKGSHSWHDKLTTNTHLFF